MSGTSMAYVCAMSGTRIAYGPEPSASVPTSPSERLAPPYAMSVPDSASDTRREVRSVCDVSTRHYKGRA
eukprot:3705290-Rhodomonas_salina.3